jgi:thymidylate synthase (FAD)
MQSKLKIVEPSYEILTPIDGTEILKHLERIARTCYRSENLISEDDSSARKIIGSLIKSGHEAMIEHYSISVRFICDVGFYKDISRHRLASFAIESTRYCNYSKNKFGNQISFIKPVNIKEGTPEYELWYNTLVCIQDNYNEMSKLGANPDQLRMILPHSTAAEVNITANLREWRHIFKLRTNSHAHPSLQELLIPLLKEFQSKIPIIFDDIIV